MRIRLGNPLCHVHVRVLLATPLLFGEKLKGSLLKGSFACALTCRCLCPSPSHPTLPFPSFSNRKTTPPNPTPSPSPTDTNRNSHPFAKTTPGKNYPSVSSRIISCKLQGLARASLATCIPINLGILYYISLQAIYLRSKDSKPPTMWSRQEYTPIALAIERGNDNQLDD